MSLAGIALLASALMVLVVSGALASLLLLEADATYFLRWSVFLAVIGVVVGTGGISLAVHLFIQWINVMWGMS